jgi:hypothetical protein
MSGQTPPVHVVLHTTPQPPQFCGSMLVSTQAPAQMEPPSHDDASPPASPPLLELDPDPLDEELPPLDPEPPDEDPPLLEPESDPPDEPPLDPELLPAPPSPVPSMAVPLAPPHATATDADSAHKMRVLMPSSLEESRKEMESIGRAVPAKGLPSRGKRRRSVGSARRSAMRGLCKQVP